MNEFDSPNYAEFSYDVKSEGKIKTKRTIAIICYVLFVAAYFLVCYVSRVIPAFAISPLITWILVFFTWNIVSYDYYFEFKTGILELGKIKGGKKGRKKHPELSIHIKEASFISPYNGEYTEKAKEAEIVYDFSSSQHSDKRILVLFEKDGKKCAAIFEGTAKIANLLASFCQNSHDIKGKVFHG
ncbi:MAG: hypothetical protein J6D20_03480 [Clostridia bacterium]|nr:hypothetical protein [Clostridia bacterium]